MNVYLQNPPTVRIGGQVTKSLYQFSMQSTDKKELYESSEKLRLEVENIPGMQDVTSDLLIKSPQVNVKIERDKAAGIAGNATQIEKSMCIDYWPRWVSTIYSSIDSYK